MFERFTRWLTGSRGGKAASQSHNGVAAFGKHPAWQDFMEIAIDSRPLADVKRYLHVGGIKPNLDRDDEGAWSRLTPEQKLDGFDHLLLWKMRRDVVVGRFWSSHDGSISQRPYPMFVCAHLRGFRLDFLLERVWPALEWFEAATRQASEKPAIERALGQTRAHVLEIAREGEPAEEQPEQVAAGLAAIAGTDGWGDGHIGLVRVLYEIERDMSDFRPGGSGISTLATSWNLDRSARQIRVPRVAEQPGAAAKLWIHAMSTLLDPSSPVLALCPMQRPWVDIIVGMPGAEQAFCILASDKAMPLSSDVPYPLDPAFQEKAAATIARWRSGHGAPGPDTQNGTVPAAVERNTSLSSRGEG